MLVCGVAMMASGCATKALHEFASKEELRDHRIAEVISASRGEDGTILMCTTGWPAMRSRDIAPVAFSISFPLSLFENASEAPPALDDEAESIASYRLAPERMGEACPKDPADADAIRVRRVDREYFGGGPADTASRATIAPFLDEDDPGALVYVLGAGDNTRSPLVVYQHAGPIFRGSRLVAIEMPSETVKPNNAAYIAMPFALVADAALGVVFVAVFALAAVASGS
jgi:hypothetical protein